MRDLKRAPGKAHLSKLPGQDCPDPQHAVNLYPLGGSLQAIMNVESDDGGADLALGPGGFGTLKRAGCP